MKIVVDNAIPYIKGVLEPYAEVNYFPGAEISKEDVADADALIVRTRTKCNSLLLEGSSVKMIATATIGTDHIDMAYCSEHGIEVASAPGCNATAVCQWVYAALLELSKSHDIPLEGKTIGIIGVGHVGGKVAAAAGNYGLKVLMNDPPREKNEGGKDFVSVDYLLANSDIVTMHVPLDEATRNMASEEFFQKMKENSIFINCSRGDVVNEAALMHNIDRFSAVAIDVWRNEPHIDRTLLSKADIATMHIAGYSRQGKINATNMVLKAVCDHFHIPSLKSTEGDGCPACFAEPYDYDIMSDDRALRSNPDGFEQLRISYNYR